MNRERVRISAVIAFACTFIIMGSLIATRSMQRVGNPGSSDLLQAPASSDLPATTFPGKATHIQRVVAIDSFGTFYTKDTVTFKNDGTEPIQEYYFCLNQYQVNNLYDTIAKLKTGAHLQVERIIYNLNGFNTWRVLLPNVLFPGETITFQVWQYFNALDITVDAENATVQFNSSTFAIIPYQTDLIETAIKLPPSSVIQEYLPDFPGAESGPNSLDFSSQLSAPFNNIELYVKFINNIATFIENEKSIKTIKVSTNHAWKVSDHVVVKNVGKASITTLTFTVPREATNFKAKDSIGIVNGLSVQEIEDTVENEDVKTKNVTINLKSNRYVITSGKKLSLTLSFSLPAKDRMSNGAGQNIVLFDVYSISRNPWISRDTDVKVGFPQANTINTDDLLSMPDEMDFSDGFQYLVFKESIMGPNSYKPINVQYTYSNFQLQGRPLLLALVFGVITSFFIVSTRLLRSTTREYVGPKRDIPIDELREFTSIFEEKVGLYLSIERLNEDFGRRKIKKREFIIKIKDFTKKLKTLDEEIAYSKKKLIDFGGRLKEIIEDLDVLEAERQSVQESLLRLESQYKTGKIKSRIAFERLYDKYAVRLKKIQTAIDSGVNELKSYYI
ncbi:hypothetical protein GF325_12885 [Candidatus Bathyarchaeota archaeon]|nr:hypothetical protein [Candidatus Bathyarchaeota archaeon]